MNFRRPVMGAASGLLLAVVLIAGVSLVGAGSQHFDLLRASTPGAESGGFTTGGQPVGTGASPQTSTQTAESTSAGSAAAPISSLANLTNQGGGTIALLLLPVLLGAALGGLFFGIYSRRVDRE